MPATRNTYSASTNGSRLADAAAALAAHLGDAVLGLISTTLGFFELMLYLPVLGEVHSSNLLLQPPVTGVILVTHGWCQIGVTYGCEKQVEHIKSLLIKSVE